MIKSDILILSGVDATLSDDDTKLNWHLLPSDFSSWENGDKIYIKANSIQFVGDIIGGIDISGEYLLNNVFVTTTVNLENLKNTGGSKNNILGSVESNTLIDGVSGDLTVKNLKTIFENPILFKVSKFEDISIQISYMNNYLTLTDLKQYFGIGLEIQYH